MTNIPAVPGPSPDPLVVAIGRHFAEISDGVPENLTGFALEQVAYDFGFNTLGEMLIELQVRMALGWLFAGRGPADEES